LFNIHSATRKIWRKTLRSSEWYAGEDRNSYIHRAWMRRGVPADFGERPQIAIANTASDLTPCNSHLDEIAQSVKNGVYEAGGIPLNLPVVSLGETQVKPTAMLWRNMAAMAIHPPVPRHAGFIRI
jgi:dihydroxyacid dehydratase/phosphogluconate dehydratase